MDLLEQRDPQHLCAIQPTTPPIGSPLSQQVGLHELPDLGVLVQQGPHHLQLSGMLVRAPGGHERELSFSELAHRFTPRFAI
ncbi:MAG: hypothetical protein OEN48_19195 [Betaproteobacteria bacterium]|nr:hypothetical protein [Betaproteobacteria bacterium]